MRHRCVSMFAHAAALLIMKRDADAEWREWERRAKLIADAATANAKVRAESYVPPIANHVPHVRLSWPTTGAKLLGPAVRQQLRSGDPSIEIVLGDSPPDAERQEIALGVWMLQAGEAELVARRVGDILKGV